MSVTFPRPDQAFLAWNQNFYTVANPIATSLGLTTTALTAFSGLVTAFQTALAACEPGVRSKQATAAKKTARASLQHSAKLLVSIVDGQAGVSDSQKIALGINVRKPPTPSAIPDTAPVIQIDSVSGFTVKIRLRATTTGKKRGKPAGVSGAGVFTHISETTPPLDISQWKFEGNTGQPSLSVQFPNTLAKGATVWFSAFWFNGAKQGGPLSPPVSTVLQGGTVTMTEGA